MRAMWKGAVAFGLVNVPIKLYAATEDHDVRFHQVHAADGGRIKMQRICSIDGAVVEYKDLGKAYESDAGQTVLMSDDDFDGLPVPGVREIEVLEFVPSEQVDPVLFDRSYYLEPEAKAIKPYVLLRQALEETERTAIVRVVLRNKTQLAALRVRGDVLVMQTMLWPDEVRQAEFDVLDSDVEIKPAELAMAASLIDSLASDFDPGEYTDEYRAALLEVIDRKLAGGEGVIALAASTDTDDAGDGIVVDLMAALRESVKRHQESRGATSETAEAAAPRRTAAAKASKPAATKSTARAAKTTAAPKKAATKTTKSTAKTAQTKSAETKTSRRATA
jgi:DNA end-binding protein Ku